jgi:hypothetical protein
MQTTIKNKVGYRGLGGFFLLFFFIENKAEKIFLSLRKSPLKFRSKAITDKLLIRIDGGLG